MTESQQLLAEYVETGSETAFRELVARYISLVYSTALRLVEGDTASAEDVTQIVFLHLSRNARKLAGEALLGGWLHRDACYVAAKTLRRERRRQAREREAVLMNSLEDHSPANLDKVARLLDEAINQLGTEDRTAVLLRFFEQHDFRAVGAALGSTEDAARMRVTRALEKLQVLLKHRGVTLSAAALGTALAGEAVSAAPVGLAASVAGSVLASSAAGGGMAATVLKIMAMTKLKVALGTVVAAGIGTTLVLERQAQAKLGEDNRVLQQQVEQLTRLSEANQGLSDLLAQGSTNGSPLDQLGRLRNEAAQLRQQKRGLEQALAENRQLRSARAGESARPLSPSERWPNPLFVLPKESWTFAGYATPETAVQSMLWAGLSGDAEAILNSSVPEMRDEAKTQAAKERMATIISGNMKRWSGLRILEKQTLADDEVAFTVHAQGVDSVFKLKFKRIGAEWKANGEDSAE
jgi:RNA polymerase sigma factor (sigma-70 family)